MLYCNDLLILFEGNFGQVFVGELTGNDNAPMKVAVKMLRGQCDHTT